MTEKRSEAAAVRRWVASIVVITAVALVPSRASAEKVVPLGDGWQIYTDGRAGAFASWAHGDGFPQPVTEVITNADGSRTAYSVSLPTDGGFKSVSEQQQIDPDVPGRNTQGTINLVRLRSGYISNVFGFGLRGPVTEWTKFTVYLQFWAFVENDARQKNVINPVDARQGWAKIEGPWGALTAGRVRALFSRGATDIDTMYAHRWGVGMPGTIDGRGPTLGQIGFGVLGSGFSSGIIYGTPSIGGLQLDVGAFDAVILQATGSWIRTKYPLAQAELTFTRTFRDGWGKVVLFGNGGYQQVYKDAACTPFVDPETGNTVPCSVTSLGAGYGGRFEFGPFHLGLAGHTGKGLGLNYALESSDGAQDKQGNLRKITGWYVQTQVVVKKFDLFAGWGLVQVFLSDYDNKHTEPDTRPGAPAGARVYPFNVLKTRMGINAGIVYNATPNLHFDLDFFRAEADYFDSPNVMISNGAAFPAIKQVVYVTSGGMIINW